MQKLLTYNEYLVKRRAGIKSNLLYIALERIALWKLRLFRPIIRFFLSTSSPTPCDILVLPSGPADISQTKGVWDNLEKNGYKIEYANYTLKSIFLNALRSKEKIESEVHTSIFLFAAYCKFLLNKYKPKTVCVFYHHNMIPSFLMKYKDKSQKIIHIPHGMQPDHYLYTSFDFDYYLVFGESSIEAIKKKKLRIGNTKLIKTGSTTLKKEYSLEPNKELKNILFFSDYWPEMYPRERRFFDIVFDWAKQHPEYNLLVKQHPVEKGDLLRSYAKGIDNVEVLDKSVGIKEALERTSLCIVGWSVASLEAAQMNRPVVVANFREYDPDSDDYVKSDSFLHLEKFFPKRAGTSEELHERISEVVGDYEKYLGRCREFVHFHLEHTTESNKFAAQVISNIHLNSTEIEYTEVEETLETLNQE
ncbi:MAG TPA: hypothetical protein EYN69_10525 [Flavobacteriales bacterium]|nr:hypothetical protein [Flavobacteriales bacterium]